MNDRETRILLGKELRQLVASKAAVATSALLPLFMLGVIPLVMLAAASGAGGKHPDKPLPPAMQFGVFSELQDDPRRLPLAMLPIMVATAALILPTMNASYLLITERERRTLELLVALPVRIDQVLKAKLIAVLAMSCVVTVPLVAIDIASFIAAGVARPSDVLGLPVLLVCVLGFSTGTALLMSLLAKDFRAANNLGGAILAPAVIGTMLLGMTLPGGVIRPLVLALLYAIAAAVVTRIALKTVTFERLLS